MNRIEVVQEHIYNDSVKHMTLYIDGARIDQKICGLSGDKIVNELLFAWQGLEIKHESKYIWELIDSRESANIPILVCPDDADLSCYLIVVKVKYEEDRVVWEKFGKSIGMIHPDGFESEFVSGIRDFENWSEEYWNLYGGVLDTFDINDESWDDWISENWEIESSLRMWKYYHLIYNYDDNIEWYNKVPKFEFDVKDYDACIEVIKNKYLNEM